MGGATTNCTIVWYERHGSLAVAAPYGLCNKPPSMSGGAEGYVQAVPAADAESVRGWLMRFIRRRAPNESEVEDMVQDVFVRIAARDSSEPVEHLGAYVMRTAQSVIADRRRRWRSRRRQRVRSLGEGGTGQAEWRTGMLDFDEELLANAAAAMN